MAKGKNDTVITNRRARHDYQIEDVYTAGIVLKGTEVKSLRNGKASLQEAFCYIADDEVFIKDMNIAEYTQGGIFNHDPKRDRKLLLKKKEIERLRKALEVKGYTLIPLKLYFNDRNYAKVNLGIGKGKKTFDKRESLKERETQREVDRQMSKY
jgi:SsrA-binding protein